MRNDAQAMAHFLRVLRLEELCSQLSDELLGKLALACREPDREALRAVLSVVRDPLILKTLWECMLSEEGRADVLESVELQKFNLARPVRGNGWIS